MTPKINRHFWFLLLVFLILYLVTRLQNLTAIPVFGDEAIYLRWSQIIKSVETLRFIPLTDGKQPLFMWLTVPIFKFVSNPLIAGRLLSVLAGLVTAITLYFITHTWYAPFFYLVIPFTFFFDRLALSDGLLSMFGGLSLLFSLLLATNPRLDLSLILGGILGLSWLTKSPAIFFIILAFFTFLVFNFNPKKVKYVFYPLISLFVAFCIYNVLRLGPQFHQIALRNQDYVWPITEILRHPLDPLKPHLSDIVTIFSQYIGPILVLLLLSPRLFLSSPKLSLVLVSWSIFPLLANAIFAKVFTARYVLYTVPPLISFISLTINQYRFKYKKLFLVLCLVPNIYWLYRISFNPATVILPSTETGYLQEWTSGWGISDAAGYLITRAKEANVIVGTEGYFGTLPDGLQIFVNNVPRLTVVGVGLGFTQIPSNLLNAYNFGDEVYLLINQSRLKLDSSELQKLKVVREYPKPGNDKLVLFQL